MEFWDALEDSQYLDAVASVRDGPKPICKFEIPTEEELLEWETRVRARQTTSTRYDNIIDNAIRDKAEAETEKVVQDSTSIGNGTAAAKNTKLDAKDCVEVLTLDWYVSSPIGLFFFSSFVKEQYQKQQKRSAETAAATPKGRTSSTLVVDDVETSNNNTNHTNNCNEESVQNASTPLLQELADEHAAIRMNFVEDLLRFQHYSKTKETKRKQVQYGQRLLRYVVLQQSAKKDSDADDRGEEDDTNDNAIETGSGGNNGTSKGSSKDKDLSLAAAAEIPTQAGPELTNIRELDLKLPKRTVQRRLGCATPAAVEAAIHINHDDTYTTNTIGLKGPLLQEFVETMTEWISQNDRGHRIIQRADSDSFLNRIDQHLNSSNNKKKHDETHKSMPLDMDFDLDDGLHDKIDNHNGIPAQHPPASPPSPAISILPIVQKVEATVYQCLKRDYDASFQSKTTPTKQYMRMRNYLWYQDRRVIYDDFYVMRVLGRGGFGLVSACQKGTTGKLYAMKVMSKRRIKSKKSVQFVMNERKALAAVAESPFIINLKYSLHSSEEIYLILDLMSGGDLGFHLHHWRRFGPNQCLYYAARIMLGLQALHDKGYAYRDLKPENCLLAEDGRVKLTDLGLAISTQPNLPSGVVGTRGYWAPEMHTRDDAGKRAPYNHVVDWFSFGCCLAEFISGKNPFRSQAAFRFGVERGEKEKDKALDCAIREMDPEFNPEEFSADAADLCRRLLDKDPKTRLGAHGCEEIMIHPWFKTVEWESIITDRKKPPFVPAKDVNAASQHEIGSFASDVIKGTQDVVFDKSDEEVYKRWDWTNPDAMAAEILEFVIFERELGRPLLPDSMTPDLCCCNIL